MKRKLRKTRTVPRLNTAALPDLIFTVLFFFMIVTHMRSEPLKVKYQLPKGSELTQLAKKSNVCYIYIGRPLTGNDRNRTVIQLNGDYVSVDEIATRLETFRQHIDSDEADAMIVSLKADKDTPMGLITDVKQQLRKANVLRISYSAANDKPKTE